ncbi:hypothetical protein ASF61_06050 [Duganella sp. Leaf126]|uniref:type II secretion system protein M n=1 Tax=Duganella sp. Leaf126 TaxID=1736266 RepID=UPI0006F54393|nr:type II secretion system protein M [Duganella sp. Leaf126]KQQ40330.1 hypothetical protein ASF61_06050 [Duganella sp. Leaf126]
MKRLNRLWLTLSTRLDAMTLRERALVFVAATGLVLFLLYTFAVQPLIGRQTALLADIARQQQQIGNIDADIVARARGFVADPDARSRQQLQQVRDDSDRITASLLAVQKGLVAPQKIAPLLEHLLRGNGKLKLVSLRTLPVTGMNQAASPLSSAAPGAAPAGTAAAVPAMAPSAAAPAGAAASIPATATTAAALSAGTQPGVQAGMQPAGGAAAAAATTAPRELLYRHSVEIVVQGSYLDMIDYMQALETLPAQLFWGGARLDATRYPSATLTLTLSTLSLDEKWMTL